MDYETPEEVFNKSFVFYSAYTNIHKFFKISRVQNSCLIAFGII